MNKESSLNNMSGKKAIIAIVIIVLIIILGIFYFKGLRNRNNAFNTSSNTPASNAQNQPIVNSSDSTDPALDQDLQKVGTNLNNLDNQANSVDQGLNQQAVDPTK